jgi:hypothetical protein
LRTTDAIYGWGWILGWEKFFQVEERLYACWEEKGYFKPVEDNGEWFMGREYLLDRHETRICQGLSILGWADLTPAYF